MAKQETAEQAYKKDMYYRDSFAGLMFFIKAELAVVVVLALGFMVYTLTNTVQDRYWVHLPGKTEQQLVGLEYPNMTRVALMSWATQAVTEIMTFGFHDYNERLSATRRHFTDEGWQSFREAMLASDTIKNLTEYQQIVTAAPMGAPVLMKEGIVGEKYQFVMQVSLLVTFKVGNKSQPQRKKVILTIDRVPTSENPYGVGIQNWVEV